MLSRSRNLSPTDYARRVGKALDRVFEATTRSPGGQQRVALARDASELRIVVFSDLHRGTRDGADDFRRAHRAYRAALGWYREQGCELWLLGDVEELWENKAADVIEAYEELLELEQRFVAPDGPGLRRFYGNHDLEWRRAKSAQLLRRRIGDGPVLESLALEVREEGQRLGLLFFVHGHQGTPGSDSMAWISKFAVGTVWRALQRSQGWIATTPAQDTTIRHKHDAAMFEWARSRATDDGLRPVLVAGHTHHPIFPTVPPPIPGEAGLAALRRRLDAERDPARRAELAAEIELVRAIAWEGVYQPPEIVPPCYFNTGCSSFPDGDVTCLEIDGAPLVDADDESDGRGKIRLMRWLDNDGKPRPQQLASRPLREVLADVRSFAAASARG